MKKPMYNNLHLINRIEKYFYSDNKKEETDEILIKIKADIDNLIVYPEILNSQIEFRKKDIIFTHFKAYFNYHQLDIQMAKNEIEKAINILNEISEK